MPEADPYKTWLADFKKEIDALADRPSTASQEAARNAQSAFSAWWRCEMESVVKPAPPSAGRWLPAQTSRVGAAERPGDHAPGLAESYENLAQEKTSLEAEIVRLNHENAQLRRREDDHRAAQEETAAELTRMKESQAGSASLHEANTRLLEEQLLSLRRDKDFLEKTFERLEARAQGLEADLRQAQDKATAAEQESLETRRRLGGREEELQRLQAADAAAQATIAELRQQTGSFQEHLVSFQENTGSDVALLRQELREFLIKVKRLIDEAAGRTA